MRVIAPLCLCKDSECADVSTMEMEFRLLFCMSCGKYKLEYIRE